MLDMQSTSQWRQKNLSLKKALDTARSRLFMTGIFYVFVMLIVCGRLVDLTLLRNGGEPAFADQAGEAGLKTGRADILDRNGMLLATTITTSSCYANPALVSNHEEAVKKLKTVLPDIKSAEILKRMKISRSFVWIGRHLTPQQKAAVLKLGIPGVSFMHDTKRLYPHGRLASHVLGFTNVDSHGISGLEKGLEDRLTSQSEPIVLSVDARLQHIVQDELKYGIDEFSANAGCAVVLDIESGEVLAMASLPDFNPNDPAKSHDKGRFNMATLGMYEMGSTMKIPNTAMVLDAGVVKLDTKIDTSEAMKIGRFLVTDYRRNHGVINVANVFVKSSNKGSAKMALEAGAEKQKEFLKKIGCLDKIDLEIPEMGNPQYPKRWREANTMTISYGYGLSISPLHLATAVSSIVSGYKTPVTLLKKRTMENRERVISQKTAQQVNQLMRFVVTDGTSRKAAVDGYFVSAKTGTRNILVNGKYQNNRVATSFVGVLGDDNKTPKYVVVVLLDDPKRLKKTFGFNAAGWNAAPVGGRIIARMAPVLNIMPHESEPVPSDPFLRNVSFKR